ncbi:unnamed protein product [Acanthoscelides obtectus]|uniref:Uncharacterized protein n=1 Tax=Acanthoscelides obtectus TaxID=200917 RepID=A0A9P0JUT8_ACAOB|nr:unnamed protein product [Acanthoscelides obtectus]CAK1648897.1 hypothetical protein AOBTE_LOCUS15949 [Acanthoscelides obtectus]
METKPKDRRILTRLLTRRLGTRIRARKLHNPLAMFIGRLFA